MIKSPITYIGSKYKLLDRLIPLFPTDGIDTFVDMFTGGGSVYMNVAHLYPRVIANDVLSVLIDVHKSLCDVEFFNRACSESKATKTSQSAYIDLRDRFNQTQDPCLLLALIFSCNSNMMRFNSSGGFNQSWGQRCASQNTIDNYLSLRSIDTSSVEFSDINFSDYDLSKLNNSTFIYLDPPYSNTCAGYTTTYKSDPELIVFLKYLISNDVKFGISGCVNETTNPVYDFLAGFPELHTYWFGDLYTEISKSSKPNNEYYITNVVPPESNVLDL